MTKNRTDPTKSLARSLRSKARPARSWRMFAETVLGLRDLEAEDAEEFAELYGDGGRELAEALVANPLIRLGLPGDEALDLPTESFMAKPLGVDDVVRAACAGDPVRPGDEAAFGKIAKTPDADALIKSVGRNPLFVCGMPGDEEISFDADPALPVEIAAGNTGDLNIRLALPDTHKPFAVSESGRHLSLLWNDNGVKARELAPVAFHAWGRCELAPAGIFDELLILLFNGGIELEAGERKCALELQPGENMGIARLTAPIGETLPSLKATSASALASGLVVGSACIPWQVAGDAIAASGNAILSSCETPYFQSNIVPIGHEALAFARTLPVERDGHAHLRSINAGHLDVRRLRRRDTYSRYLDVRLVVLPGRRIGAEPFYACHQDRELIAPLHGSSSILTVPQFGGVEDEPITLSALRKANPGIVPHHVKVSDVGRIGHFSPEVATFDSREFHCASAHGYEDSVCLHVMHTPSPMHHIQRDDVDRLNAFAIALESGQAR